jgi:anti-anti-sigma factor
MAGDAEDSTSSGEQQLHLGQVAVGHYARGIAVVTLRGEHDLSTQSVIAYALELAAAHSNVVVDLTNCSFIDSTTIQELIKTSTSVHAKGEQLILVMPRDQPDISRIAEIVGLAQIFELHETKQAALASLKHATRDDARRAMRPVTQPAGVAVSAGFASARSSATSARSSRSTASTSSTSASSS